MPKRPDVSGALGREAILGGAPVVDGKPARARRAGAARGGRPAKAGEKWDDLNERVTFHCPTDLHQALKDLAAAGDRSKSQIIVDAIAKEIGAA